MPKENVKPKASQEVRKKKINDKIVRIEYQEKDSPEGQTIVQYKVFVDGKPYPLKCEISKDLLQTIHDSKQRGIYNLIPESIFDRIKNALFPKR